MASIAGFDGSKIKSRWIYLEPQICLWLFFLYIYINCIKPTLIFKPCVKVSFIFHLTGQFLIQKVVPQASGESSKVKVKVRVNIHGIFSVSSASLVEVQKADETEEPMETEQANEKDEQVRPHEPSFPLWKTGGLSVRSCCVNGRTYLFTRTRCRLIRMSSRIRETAQKNLRKSHVRMKKWR